MLRVLGVLRDVEGLHGSCRCFVCVGQHIGSRGALSGGSAAVEVVVEDPREGGR